MIWGSEGSHFILARKKNQRQGLQLFLGVANLGKFFSENNKYIIKWKSPFWRISQVSATSSDLIEVVCYEFSVGYNS